MGRKKWRLVVYDLFEEKEEHRDIYDTKAEAREYMVDKGYDEEYQYEVTLEEVTQCTHCGSYITKQKQ
jgi:hypothetical protein